MEYLFGLDLAGVRRRWSSFEHPNEKLRAMYWKDFRNELDELHWRSTMSPFGGVVKEGKVFQASDLAWLPGDAVADVGDPRMQRILRKFTLATARHVLHHWDSRFSATLGIIVPDAKILVGAEEAFYDRFLATWVYPTTPPAPEVAFLGNPDDHFGIADPDQVAHIVREDDELKVFEKLSNHFGASERTGLELAKIPLFLRLCVVERLWVCFSEART